MIGSSGGLKNVVIFLDDPPVSNPADAQKLNLIENNGCRYAPRIVAMQKGEQLKVKNADPKDRLCERSDEGEGASPRF